MENKKNNYLLFFFLFLFIYNFFQIVEYSYSKYAFQYGDWLINYSNGFVRRGLIGEFFLIVKTILGINIQHIYILFLTSLLIIFYLNNYLILKKININIYFLLFILSPFLFLFTVLNHSSGIRKEYLLLLIFVNLILNLIINPKKKLILKYIFFYLLSLLVHELSIFFLPFFLFMFLYSSEKKVQKYYYYQSISFIVLSFISIFIIYIYKGDSSYVPIICQSLGSDVYFNCLSSGAISDSFNQTLSSIFFEITNMYDAKGFWLFFFISFIYFCPFFFILKKIISFKKFYLLNVYIDKKRFFLVMLFNFFFMSPLFLIGADWGRWLSIYFFLCFYIFIFLVIKNIITINNDTLNQLNFFKYSFFKKKLVIVFFLLYSTFMTPGVFYHKEFNDKAINFNYIKIYKKLSK